jgi:hypothetical protein
MSLRQKHQLAQRVQTKWIKTQDTSNLKMDISDRVDSLRMLEDIRKKTQRHVKKLQRLINHPVEIKLFGDLAT